MSLHLARANHSSTPERKIVGTSHENFTDKIQNSEIAGYSLNISSILTSK